MLTCFSGHSNSSAEHAGIPGATVILAALMMVLVVVVVVGNALVIFAFVVDKSLRNQSNYFFLNLAISDFLVGAFCIPVYMPYILTGRWMLGRGLCKLWLVMDYLLCTASVFNIVLISYDRFLSVTRAVRYRAQQGMTQLAVGKMLAVWLLAFLLYGPAIIFWEDVAGQSIVPADECFAEFYCTWYFLLSASTFEFFSPFISVTFFNLSIYLNIQRRNKSRAVHRGAEKEDGWRVVDGGASPSSAVFFVRTRKVSSSELAPVSAVIEEDMEISPSSSGDPSCSHSVSLSLKTVSKKKGALSCWLKTRMVQSQAPSRNGEHSRLSRDKKIAKSLAIIVCVFGVCWAPYTLLMIIRAACSGMCIEHHWYEVTFWLLWLNSAINPFLYPLCHSSFRRAFAKILCPKRQSVRPHEDNPSCQ
ncbi:histamine H3 receptor isoform X1 [Tachysurus fulvidraco]|uniref:histamine H3 receptor isoform X1 n=1 Tax=Tachysurus fulvidraco TaxID=1234273 RepID=UPI000F510857|nr:histamine H3 receptor isoform X1 [Tachysurus fulvidraco]XP_027004182.1 histamine H3 receptor isoform X1 [Tachysurus fulvidraco]